MAALSRSASSGDLENGECVRERSEIAPPPARPVGRAMALGSHIGTRLACFPLRLCHGTEKRNGKTC